MHQAVYHKMIADKLGAALGLVLVLSALLTFFSLLIFIEATDRSVQTASTETTDELKQGLPGRRLGGGTRWRLSLNTFS